jgi:hypothetical protein
MTTAHFLFIIKTVDQTVLYFKFISVKFSVPRRKSKTYFNVKIFWGMKFNFHADFSLPLKELVNFIIPMRLLATFTMTNNSYFSFLVFVFQKQQQFS